MKAGGVSLEGCRDGSTMELGPGKWLVADPVGLPDERQRPGTLNILLEVERTLRAVCPRVGRPSKTVTRRGPTAAASGACSYGS